MPKSSFEFNGFDITDPTLSECGRFSVVPVEYYGIAYLKFRYPLMQANLNLSLNNAIENGYELDEWDAEEISSDLSCYDEDFECEDPQLLVPFIQEWLDARRAKVADLGRPHG